jgi:hypothetical protein
MLMSHRNSIGRALAARFDRLIGSSGARLARGGIALLGLGAVYLMDEATGLMDEATGLMDEATAAATHAAALTLGGLLLAGAVAVKRRSHQPTRQLLEFRRVRVHPAHMFDRNHR